MTLTQSSWIRGIVLFTALAVLGFVIGAGRSIYAAIYAVDFGSWFKYASLLCLGIGGAGLLLVSGARIKSVDGNE